MNIDPIFRRIFKKLYGKPCWGAKPGYGSFLTFEFGQPHLQIREPTTTVKKASRRVREVLGSRGVYVRGEWHLWIYCCDWEIFWKGKRVANSQSSRTYEKGVHALDGQKLIRFSLQPRGLHSTFEFDLGGVLVTRPYDRKSEQWMLSCPTSKVLTLRADKRYTFHASNRARDAGPWKSIFARTKV